MTGATGGAGHAYPFEAPDVDVVHFCVCVCVSSPGSVLIFCALSCLFHDIPIINEDRFPCFNVFVISSHSGDWMLSLKLITNLT